MAFHDEIIETQAYEFKKFAAAQWRQGNHVRMTLAESGFGALGVVVSFASGPGMQTGKPFAALRLQIAARLLLKCDESSGYSRFYLGLFGLGTLCDVDASVAQLENA